MMYPTLRLEAAGVDTLILDPDDGWIGQQLDLGVPLVRSVAQNAPDADGTIDTTALVGARNVTLQLELVSDGALTLWEMRQRLKAFTAARLRPTMFVRFSADDDELQIGLRASDLSDVFTNRRWATVTVQWVAPSGILESVVEHTAVATGAGTVEAGRAYDLTFNRTYPASSALGSVSVVNAGTVDAYPLIRMYGPLTGPRIENITQGRKLVFAAGLVLAAGEFVEVDTRAKTILFAGDPADSRYQHLTFPASQWFTLSPGVNLLRFYPTTFSVPAQAEIVWRDAWA